MNKRKGQQKKKADFKQRLNDLVRLIVDLKERQCLAEIGDLLAAGCPPQDLLESSIQAMDEIGKRFEDGRYFISALIMAGAIMGQATELIEPHLEKMATEPIAGTLLLGTVAGDIHDLGKDLFSTLARFRGIHVVDLGVDVPAVTFLSEARKLKPAMIGISCVLTTAWPILKETVALLRDELPKPRPPIIIGGTSIDDTVCRHIKADFCVNNAAAGIAICQRVMRKPA